MQNILKKSFLVAMIGVLVSGCYPDGPDYVEDLDVVYTTFDETNDFKSQATYSIPDKIVTDVKIKDGDTTFVYMKDVYAKQILDRIKANMKNLGWGDPVNIANKPDVLVTPAAMSTTTYYYSYWYDWWYGGYYGGWYYPPYYSVSSYTTGSLVITMADPNVETAINKTPTIWIAAANGLLGSDDLNRALKGIDQAFAQSPYLKTN